MFVKSLLQPKVAIPVAMAAIVVLGIGLYLFQPWRIFTNVEVNEALPTAVVTETSAAPAPSSASASPDAQSSSAEPTPPPPPAEPIVLAEGSFISHEHATTGTVRILELPDGSRVLRIEGLDTSDGPDLKVWLSDQPVIDGVDGWGVFDDGAYVSLGDLKGNKGNQNYPIPADVDLADYTAVSIWCERFAVSFGAAELTV
ncbi:MAG: DM13 domain-containing protein [Candidatus Nanopelagicales bacterium]